VAINTAAELKLEVDLEEMKFHYQKTKNLMINIQMQLFAVRGNIGTIIEVQNNANMYRCLYNTATPELLSRLLLEAHLHHIGETPIAAMYYK